MRSGPDEQIVHAYPSYIFVWPLVAMGYLFYFFQPFDLETEGWIYVITVCTVWLAMGVDLNRNLSIFWLIFIALIYVTGIYLRDVKQFLIFSNVMQWFRDLDVQYSPKLGLIPSIIGSICLLVIWIKTRVNDKWRITHNEIERITLWHKDDSLGRGAKRIVSSYNDLLEFLICMSGSLQVYAVSGRQILVTIEHIPFLPFRMRKISRILETLSVANEETDAEAENAQIEDMEHIG